MSEDNVEIVRGVYAHWSVGDFSVGDDLFDPEITFVMRPEFPDSGTYRGLEQLRRYTRGFLEPWSLISIEAEELIDAGDCVVAAVRQRGSGSTSGITTEFRYFQVWTLRDGLIIGLENVRDRAEALEAAGAPPA